MALVTCRECKSQISSTAVACPKCGAKPPRKTSLFTWIVGAVVLTAVLASIGGKGNETVDPQRAGGLTVQTSTPEQRTLAQQAANASEQRTTDSCRADYENQKQSYAALVAAKKPWEAATSIRLCATTLKDPELLAMVSKAEVQAHVQELKSTKSTVRDKLQALELLTRDYPSEAKPYESMRPALVARLEADTKAEDQRRMRAEAARKKKEGVSIGMTMDEVRASSWGKPKHVNRSTYSFGVHEQWVYDGGYLYFKDGTLTSIQN